MPKGCRPQAQNLKLEPCPPQPFFTSFTLPLLSRIRSSRIHASATTRGRTAQLQRRPPKNLQLTVGWRAPLQGGAMPASKEEMRKQLLGKEKISKAYKVGGWPAL